jgi:phosphomannomutase/phosphoglucomutase
MNIAAEIFRAYDIRGVVDQTLTNDTVYQIGCALGSKVLSLGGNSIVIGRDGRTSGVRLSTQLSDGIRAVGCNVVDVGLVPTPVLYFAAAYLKISSAVMLTGSHNPADYNGLKIIIDGITIYGAAIQEIYQMIMAQQFATGAGTYTTANVIAAYINEITDSLNIKRALKVVIDCGNGVPGIVAPELLNSLGCTVIPLYCDVDGTFPNHHPDPSDPHNLEVLQQTVIAQQADLGLAFDGDGDRLGIIDNTGKIIWPDRVLMLYAQQLLQQNPGATIIYDVKCSRDVEKIITAAGGVPLMWNTGHSLIKAKIRETGALLAGEMSGHVFFKDRWYGFDDALYAAARLIEILSQTTSTAEQVFAEFPEQVSTPELSVAVTEQNKFTIMQDLLNTAQFAQPHKIITIDGIRVEFADGWGLVRPSNTTPKLVIRFEAENAAALSRIQEQFRAALLNVDPDLVLPF